MSGRQTTANRDFTESFGAKQPLNGSTERMVQQVTISGEQLSVGVRQRHNQLVVDPDNRARSDSKLAVRRPRDMSKLTS